ncbi:hypothetical protein H6P81_018177 [Aristolochia fimbriata]|uniref:Uncharacterized protein n=1 Tax=Aristolochia fimbriata TaxID=158543 RepID=A0AAV7E4L0_ARIFI|nr:hypothetical protein H6P81_018177 [Aristolochia fimbriata]
MLGRIPWAFVYAWLAQRFGVHGTDSSEGDRPSMMVYCNPDHFCAYTQEEARSLFWLALPPGPIVDRPGHYASRIEVEYFCCLRAIRLVLRQRDLLIVEPYSPHRFARQFGFCQDLPGVLIADQRRAASVDALVEIWQTGNVCPLGTVEVPAFVSANADPGVTALFRESWRKFTGASTPKKILPKRAAAKKKAAKLKAAKKKVATPAPAAPAKRVVIRETPPIEDDTRPAEASLAVEGAPLGKGKAVAESMASSKKAASKKKKKSAAPRPEPLIYAPPLFRKRLWTGLRKPSTPFPIVHPPKIPASGEGERAEEMRPIAGSIVPPPEVPAAEERERVEEMRPIEGSIVPPPRAPASEGEVAAEPDVVPAQAPSVGSLAAEEEVSPSDALAIILVPPTGQPIFRSDGSSGRAVLEDTRHVEQTGEGAPSGAVTGGFMTGEAGRPRPSSLRLEQPGSAFSTRFLVEAVQLSRFVKSVLTPADDPCSPELVADTRTFLEHLRRAGVNTSVLEQWVEDFAMEAARLQRLRGSLGERLSLAERRITEAELERSIWQVKRQRDNLIASLDRHQAEREAVETEQTALRDRLAFLSSRLDSLNAELGTIRRGLDAAEEEVSAVVDFELSSL